MTALLVLAGFVAIGAGIVLREVPRVVTGISLFSLLQFSGLLLLLYAWFRRRQAFAAWIKAYEPGKHVRTVLVLVWLALAMQFVGGVVSEIEEGKHYDRVSVLLQSKKPQDALTLASFLPVKVTESAPLRDRILIHLAELGYRHLDVTGPVRTTVKEDPDRAVRTRAVETLGQLMTPRDVLIIIRNLEKQDPETRQLLVQALVAGTGENHGADPAAWRAWFGETFAGAEPQEAFALAILAWRNPARDENLRKAAFRRIRSGEGSDVETLRGLANDRKSADVRGVAAELLSAKGDKGLVVFFTDLLLKETDAFAATVQAAGIRKLDPRGADRRLYNIAERAPPGAGRRAARSALLGEVEIDEEDPTALTVFLFEKQKDSGERQALFEILLRKAEDGEAARWQLRRLVFSEKETDGLRIRALLAADKADEGVLPDGDLISLFENKGGREFKERVRALLKKRTGKDAGLDADAWRDALK